MRITCLVCGHQFELPTVASGPRQQCPGCAAEYDYPEIHNTGVRPNERAAERSRARAFRAAGLVKNTGGFALGLSALGVLFFPLGLVGALLGVYVLAMLRGPVGRYSGRHSAVGALALGAVAFIVGINLTRSFFETRRLARVANMQESIGEDLRAVLRAERLFRAGKDTYTGFERLRIEGQHGLYTLYLAPHDVLPARRDGAEVTDPLPAGLQPGYSESEFTVVAVGNLDDDPDPDVWVMYDTGKVEHVQDDMAEKTR